MCQDHCTLIQKEAPNVPNGLRQFLKYCGSEVSGKMWSAPFKYTRLWYIVKMWNFPLFSADHHFGNQSGIDVVIGRLEVDNTGVGESFAQSQGIVNVYPFTIISKGFRIAKSPP